MFIKRQISAIKNRDWSSKTQKENAKYVKSKLKMLGYKVPNYMKKGLLKNEQLEFYVNRIINKLTKMSEKEEKKKQRRKYTPREGNKQKLLRLTNELNSRLDEIHKYIDDNYSGQIVEYLKGNMSQLPTRDKAFNRDKFNARKINLNNLVFDDIKSAIKMVQGRLNTTTMDNFISSLKDSEKEDKWFNENLLDDSLLSSLGSREINGLKRAFNDLSPIQKEFYLKDYLSELREKYKVMEEHSGDDYFDYDKIGYILYNRIMSSISIYSSI